MEKKIYYFEDAEQTIHEHILLTEEQVKAINTILNILDDNDITCCYIKPIDEIATEIV